ncbi:VOC family protein [Kineococcus sp. TBRC 1896]|uniref:VOC family protein n=1 Tax=Kineococcus mangrovi TaxID=1660183 RepID=A0ABV4I540_9ACTN
MTTTDTPAAQPTGIHHVRLTVTDIARSKAFYQDVFDVEPAVDFSAEAADPGVREDPERLYGGCVFALGDQLLGLRPVAEAGDRFVSTRVGLDHVSLRVGSRADLERAAERLAARGVEHGQVLELDQGIAILSLQDPDDINLELTAPL